MNERLIHLRIKIKSLAAEAKIIRKESKKTTGMTKWRLQDHNKTIVRVHTRHNLLAYGMILGTPYNVMEIKCDVEMSPDFSKVFTIGKRFGGKECNMVLWIEEAKTHIKTQRRQLNV